MAWSECISAKALYPVNNSLQVAPDQFVLQSLWQALLLRIAIEQPIERTLLHLGGVVGAYLLAERGRSQRRAPCRAACWHRGAALRLFGSERGAVHTQNQRRQRE